MPKVGVAEGQKEKIIIATLECICQKGISRITLEQVASRSGVSKGIVSYYFANKHNLLLAAFEAFLRYYGESITREVVAKTSASEMLRTVIEFSLPRLKTPEDASMDPLEEPKISSDSIPPREEALLFLNFYSLAMLEPSFKEVIAKVYASDLKGISEIFQYGISTGEFAEGCDDGGAFVLLALIVGISVFRVTGVQLPATNAKGFEDVDYVVDFIQAKTRKVEER